MLHSLLQLQPRLQAQLKQQQQRLLLQLKHLQSQSSQTTLQAGSSLSPSGVVVLGARRVLTTTVGTYTFPLQAAAALGELTQEQEQEQERLYETGLGLVSWPSVAYLRPHSKQLSLAPTAPETKEKANAVAARTRKSSLLLATSSNTRSGSSGLNRSTAATSPSSSQSQSKLQSEALWRRGRGLGSLHGRCTLCGAGGPPKPLHEVEGSASTTDNTSTQITTTISSSSSGLGLSTIANTRSMSHAVVPGSISGSSGSNPTALVVGSNNHSLSGSVVGGITGSGVGSGSISLFVSPTSSNTNAHVGNICNNLGLSSQQRQQRLQR